MTTTAALSPRTALPPDLPTVDVALAGAGGGRSAAARAAAGAAVDAFVGEVKEGVIEAAGRFVLEQSGLKAASAKGSTTTRPAPKPATLPKELAFLNDPNMSVHEKVFRLMLHLQRKYDDQVEAKLKEIAAARKGTTASTLSGGTKKTGKKKSWWKKALGKVSGGLKLAFPAMGLSMELLQSPAGRKFLKELSGPVLAAAATAAGMPQLAPLAAKLGPELVDGAAAAADALEDDDEAPTRKAAASASGASSSASSSSSGAANEKELATELEFLLERQKSMNALLSNCMRSLHETQMSVIQNIR